MVSPHCGRHIFSWVRWLVCVSELASYATVSIAAGTAGSSHLPQRHTLVFQVGVRA